LSSLRIVRASLLAAGLLLAWSSSGQEAPGADTTAELRRLLEGGRYADAERDARASLAALEVDGRGESAAAAEVLDVLVAALWRGGKASDEEAVTFAERAIETKETLFGPADPALATSLDNAGVLFFVRGDYDRAGPLYERARVIWTEVGASMPGRNAELAKVHSHLGPLFQELGQYSTARGHYEQALALLRETLGPEHTQVAMTENNLATLLARIGDYGEAQGLYRNSLAILERQLGGEHPLIGNSKHNLAELDQRMGRDDEAIELYREAAALKERVLGAAHPSLALTLSNLSYLYSDRAEPETAESLATRALEINERAYGSAHVDLAYSLVSLGRAQTGRGDLAIARATLERALDLRTAALGPENPLLVPPLHFLSQVLLRAGAPREAFEHALRAESIARNNLRLTARGAPERQALRYAAERLSSLDIALAVAADLQDPSLSTAGWDGLIRSRAVVLDEMAVRHRLSASGSDPSSSAAFAAYRSAAERLVNVLLRGPGSGSVDDYRRRVAELRAVEEAAERSVAAANETVGADLAAGEIGYDEIRASMPEGAILVAFARIGGGRHTGVAAQYVAFVDDGTVDSPRLHSLGSAADVETAIRRWRDELGTDASMPDAARHRQAGERLRELLWDPLDIEIGGDPLVLIVPAGAIHLVNFSALPLTGGRFLAEADVLIHYLASERDLLAGERGNARPGLLVVGGAEFAARPSVDLAPSNATSAAGPAAVNNCDVRSALDVRPLPGSLREVRRVASIWMDARGRGPAIELAGGDATKAAFQLQAAGKTAIHVATHGFFVANDCLTEVDDVPSPLRLSGLMFAAAGSDAGGNILLAEEVATMDLRDAQWVVLSGCDTGVGQIDVDEGILGLRRAFRVAGAQTLVMSLWPVEDQSTEAFMAGLYEARLSGGQSTVSAMRAGYRAALAAARRQYGEHPRYWAPFIASGDWR
jgi:tetratricopeptide (TPR) repeat protein